MQQCSTESRTANAPGNLDPIAHRLASAIQQHCAGRLDDAFRTYGRILQKHPDHPATLHAMAVLNHQKNRGPDARLYAERAVAAEPRNARFHNTLGLIVEKDGDLRTAGDFFRAAISLSPSSAEAYINLAIVLINQNRHEEALDHARKATELDPENAFAHNTAAWCFETLGREQQALESYARAVALEPEFAEAHNHLGVLNHKKGLYTRAVEHYDKALQADPDYAEAHWNRALANLLTGRFIQGMTDYKWRKHKDLQLALYPHQLSGRQWRGEDYCGKTLLVHYEQGLGDSIQFLRYLPMAKALGGRLILEIQKPLRTLMGTQAVADRIIEADPDKPPQAQYDLHASLMDLPAVFATEIDAVPAAVPYLTADPVKSEYWRNRLLGPRFKVGIAWSGATSYDRNDLRSTSFELFQSLCKLPKIAVYSLQKGPRADEIRQLPANLPLEDLAGDLHDFSDTAAVIRNLDLVISVDTSVLHLAGALGAEAWGLICTAPAWQWLLDRTDSPWYPTVKLYRQSHPGDWLDVFARLERDLTSRIEHPSAAGSADNLKTCEQK